MRCTYKSWDDNSESGKIDLMRPPQHGVIIDRLEATGLLPIDFDKQNGDPFLIAPFSSDNLRGDVRQVVGFYWMNAGEDIREAWRNHAR